MGLRHADLPSASAGGQGREPVFRQSFEDLLEDIDFLFHEIRTPLTAVIGYAEILENQQLPVGERKVLLDIIAREAHHIDNLLKDFSEVYRQDNGTWLTEISLAPIDVEKLLLEVVARFKHKFAKHVILVRVPPDLPPVQGDVEKLYLVIRNLLANAIKYSPGGGEISVSVTECSKELFIRVRDQGVGIPKENLPNIFQHGFRAPPLPGNKLRGSGLGLTMVKRIIEAHNGKIYVESTPGKGTVFLLSLPKAGEPAVTI